MIDDVNKLSAPSSSVRLSSSTAAAGTEGQNAQGQDDPINQLTAILGAHLRALSSIDGNAGRLEEQVIELEGRMNVNGNRARR
jgi:nuclear pore complex protein Nup62